MSFIEEKKYEAIGGLVFTIAMGLSLVIIPDGYDYVRFFVMIVLTYMIIIAYGWWRSEKKWKLQDAPLLVLYSVWGAWSFIGAFAAIGGVIFLGLGSLFLDWQVATLGLPLPKSEIVRQRCCTNDFESYIARHP
jgi:hypothetical protein